MNKQEFRKLYARARRKTGRLNIKTIKQIKAVYIQASDDLAILIRNAELEGLSQLTINSLENINRQLQDNVEAIQKAIYDKTTNAMTTTAGFTGVIHENYLSDILDNVDTGGILTKKGMENLFIGINTTVVDSLVKRIYQNGYTFAESVWVAADDYRKIMNNVISAGFAQNRDLFKIAKDIQIYTADGKVKLLKRYGKLKSGTREFTKRIPKNVDWRAVRLVRSELYMSLQEASALQGKASPAVNGWYNWVLSAGRQDWNCECSSLQEGSPYRYNDIPVFPHPNCQCSVVPVLRNSRDFQNDLKRWVDGEQVGYINDWYNDYYLQYAS
jgi:enhancing lycopene biosynthesis protein 2